MSSSTCDCCGDQIEETCYCPLDGVINALSRKYAMQVISAIGGHGTMRYGEIEDHLSTASSATVSDRLEELVAAGLIERTQYDEIPPRVEYELTEAGHELRELLDPVLEWATRRETVDSQ
jgi:DNA-binding HxlR family transcriptional regulator